MSYYQLAEVGPSLQSVQKAWDEWRQHFGEVDPNPSGLLGVEHGREKLAHILCVEFGCYDQLDSTVDIYVTSAKRLNDNEWEIFGRWGDLVGKPRVKIQYNFETKRGVMMRLNYPN